MTLNGKTALITGSTAGIGKETARALVRMGARVLLVGRDPDRAGRTAGELGAEAFTADVTRQQDLHALARSVPGPIDILINNAGANTPERRMTADGYESMFAAHVVAPYLLAHLLPLAPGARVVNITGGIPGGAIELDNLQAERRFLGWTFSQYNHTKTIQMAMSVRLARALPEVRVNVAYPGHGDTPMNHGMAVRSFPYLYRPVAPLVRLLAPRLFGDLTKPARSSVYLASSAEVEGITGTYFGQDCRRKPWPRSVLDERIQEAVWSVLPRPPVRVAEPRRK